VLDGVDLGPAAHILLWQPRRGPHRLALVDGRAHTLESVGFEVRGTADAPPPT